MAAVSTGTTGHVPGQTTGQTTGHRCEPARGLAWLTPALVDAVGPLLEDVRESLGGVAPEYAEFLGDAPPAVRTAAETAMSFLVEHAERCRCSGTGRQGRPVGGPVSGTGSSTGPAVVVGLFEEVGRTQFRDGFPLRTLLAAYQVGGRVAWRHMAAAAVRAGAEPDALAALAEAVFFFVDELSTSSTEGYLAEQSRAAQDREHRRGVLVDLLLSQSATPAATRAAALRADWPLPRTACLVLVDPEDDVRSTLADLDPSYLPVRGSGLVGVVVPDPGAPGRRSRLATALRGASAVVGAEVAVEQLADSARTAELALALVSAGTLAHRPFVVGSHLDALVVHRDAGLLDELRRRCLAPLEAAAPASRRMLADTLRSWLRHMGERRAVAEELHVHPQTVSYRVGRLQELFGDALADPDARLQLVLALCWDPPEH